MIAEDPAVRSECVQVAAASLIGVGNAFRGDDSLGLVVAHKMASMGLHGIRIVEANGDGASLMLTWQDMDRVLIVDAMKLGSPIGTIHRIDASKNEIPAGWFTYSSHAFGVGQAIEMARQLHQLPRSVIVYGMEGGHFGFGTSLSIPLKENLPVLIRMIFSELNSWKGS